MCVCLCVGVRGVLIDRAEGERKSEGSLLGILMMVKCDVVLGETGD